MTLQEASAVLGLTPEDTAVTIKRKYHALLHRNHPDVKYGSKDAAGRIITAYNVIRSSPLPAAGLRRYETLPEINPAACCRRTLYARHNLFDDDPADIFIRGYDSYFWDPDQEEFSLFLKSILKEAQHLAQDQPERLKTVFHLLVQDFIRPLPCLEKVCDDREETNYGALHGVSKSGICSKTRCREEYADHSDTLYYLNGRIAGAVTTACPCRLQGAKLYAGSQQLSFDDDSYYYILSMLLARGAADAEALPLDEHRVRIRIRITDEQEALCPGNTAVHAT